MTYHGTGGKLLGLGQRPPSAEEYAAALANADCGVFNNNAITMPGGCVGQNGMTWLGGCFTLTPPPGVNQGTYDRFCLKSLSCNPYDAAACPDVEPWLREVFPPPSCVNRDMQGVITYCMENGFKGENRMLNGMCWAATRVPGYWAELMQKVPCEDVACINQYEGTRVGLCIANPDDPWCASHASWVASMKNKPFCPDLQQEAERAFSAVPCLGPDIDSIISYCDEYGLDGPNANMNAGCWAMQKSGGLETMRRLDFCPDYVPPGAAEPPPPEPPVDETINVELFSEETAPEEIVVQPGPAFVMPPPVAPPPAKAKMSTATMGIIGILGVGAVVGVAMLAKKKKQ